MHGLNRLVLTMAVLAGAGLSGCGILEPVDNSAWLEPCSPGYLREDFPPFECLPDYLIRPNFD